MFKDAIDQMEDDEYIEKLHRQIDGFKNDIEMVDQQNLSIMKTADKFKRKSEKLEQQNKRYRAALKEINDSTVAFKDDKDHSYHAERVARKALEGKQ